MRGRLLKITSIVCFIALLVPIVLVYPRLMRRNDIYGGEMPYVPFFEEDTDYDVLFLGSSRTGCAFSPRDLWNDYGYTSYNFGNTSEIMPVTYWTMRMAMDYCEPKVVVLDVFRCFHERKYLDADGYKAYNSWDCFPLSRTKIQAVNDLILEDKKLKKDYLFGSFNGRVREIGISKYSFVANPEGVQNGTWHYWTGSLYRRVEPQTWPQIVYDKSEIPEDSPGIIYTRKIIEYCQENDIEVLLVNLPAVCDVEEQMNANAIEDIAAEYGINYLNFVQLEGCLDPLTDMQDYRHTNCSGMKKITDYVGSFISDNYDIEDHRNDEGYALWHDDYEKFLDVKADLLKAETDCYSVLDMLHDDCFLSSVYVREDSLVTEDSVLIALLQNIGRQHIYPDSPKGLDEASIMPLKKLTGALDAGEAYFFAADGEGNIRESSGDEISPDDIPDEMTPGDEDEDILPDIVIEVKSSATGDIVTRKSFVISREDSLIYTILQD